LNFKFSPMPSQVVVEVKEDNQKGEDGRRRRRT
jgi:hypothetical protein